MQRKIIHIDMDAFFASVEQRDNPDLRGKPVAVGGNKERGVVAAASYEARRFGVKSAMASKIAFQQCPNLIFVKPRFEVYKEVSIKIREIFSRYSDDIEPLSLDEAYLDVTENKKGMLSATHIAQEIKKAIKEELNLVASAGISVNKFLAKVASDIDKPDGLYLIPPSKVQSFVENLEVSKFFGVGKVTANKMYTLGIFKGKDLKKWNLLDLQGEFGKSGSYYYNIVRGIDNREVRSNRERKSVGSETTFEKDLTNEFDIIDKIEAISKTTWKRLKNNKLVGKTITLKLKFNDFTQITRSYTGITIIDEFLVTRKAVELFETENLKEMLPIRLIGVTISNFERPKKNVIGTQLTINF